MVLTHGLQPTQLPHLTPPPLPSSRPCPSPSSMTHHPTLHSVLRQSGAKFTWPKSQTLQDLKMLPMTVAWMMKMLNSIISMKSLLQNDQTGRSVIPDHPGLKILHHL